MWVEENSQVGWRSLQSRSQTTPPCGLGLGTRLESHTSASRKMGNTASNKAPDSASGAYSPTPREETVYGDYFHPPPSSRYSSSGTYAPSSLGTTSSSVTPPVPPRASGLERRSMTVVARERPSESPVRIWNYWQF